MFKGIIKQLFVAVLCLAPAAINAASYPVASSDSSDVIQGFSEASNGKDSLYHLPVSEIPKACDKRYLFTDNVGIARQATQSCTSLRVVLYGLSRSESIPFAANNLLIPVYRAASIRSQIDLIQESNPMALRIGMLYTEKSKWQYEEAVEESEVRELNLTGVKLEYGEHPSRKLRRLVSLVDVILLPDDSELVNKSTIKPLLLGSARQGVPMFGGIAPGYIQAGIAAGKFISDGDLGKTLYLITKGRSSEANSLYNATFNGTVCKYLDVDVSHWRSGNE